MAITLPLCSTKLRLLRWGSKEPPAVKDILNISRCCESQDWTTRHCQCLCIDLYQCIWVQAMDTCNTEARGLWSPLGPRVLVV